jgi:DNA-binding CsgD family transcriptional regulator
MLIDKLGCIVGAIFPVRGTRMQNQRCSCGFEHLTLRHIEIAQLVAVGASNDHIARELHLSTHTVASQLTLLMERLRAHNRAELVARSFFLGLLDPTRWPPRRTGKRCLSPVLESAGNHRA